jgi:predicted nucleic acid-binding protein
MKVDEALRGVSSILLDTAPIIYHLEGNLVYGPVMGQFFRVRADNRILLVTSPITLVECLVHPIRRALKDLEAAYHGLVVGAENTKFCPIGTGEAAEAARLRVKYNLRLADALQAAVAIGAGCQAILTNDIVFKRVTEIRALVLNDLEL